MKQLTLSLIFLLTFGLFTASAQGGILTETTSEVRFRSGPGTDWRILQTLPAGTVLNIDARDGSNNFWVRGVIADGTAGWLASSTTPLSDAQLNSLAIKLPDAPVSVAPPAAGAQASSAPAQQPAAPAAEAETPAEAPAAAANPAPPVAANSAPVAGFAYGGHVASFSSRSVDAMRQAGMTWVKKQDRFNGSGGSGLGIISSAKGAGFRVLVGVVGDGSQATNPSYIDAYAAYVASLAAAGADAIEIWNEPNIDREWAAGQISPQAYTNLLAASYNAIKAANPNTIVVSGAPAPTGFFGGCSGAGCDDRPFIEGMAAAGAAQYMDCVGVHYNEGILPPDARSGDPRGNSGYYTRYFLPMIEVYSGAFGGQVPLCFTELGYLTPEGFGQLPGGFAWAQNVTVAQQAAWLDQAVSLAAASGRVRLIIIWNVDFSGGGADPMGGYAMIRPDGSCPACAALGN